MTSLRSPLWLEDFGFWERFLCCQDPGGGALEETLSFCSALWEELADGWG